MIKTLLTTLVVFAAASNVKAQEESATDLSRYELFEEGQAIITLAELQDVEDSYNELLANGNCAEAIPIIVEFYEAANRMANFIRRGNEPYYDASRDDKDAVARNRPLLNELIVAENAFNNLLEQRNRAWVEEAKCLLAEGDREAGITRLYRALDYIGTSESELWEEARTLLWAELGLSADGSP
jgi:hypothetical protein